MGETGFTRLTGFCPCSNLVNLVNSVGRYRQYVLEMSIMSDSIFKLIQSGEGECVEFKTASKGVYDDTFETVCSFCNH